MSVKLAFCDRRFFMFLIYSSTIPTSILTCLVAYVLSLMLLSIILSWKSNLLLTTLTTDSSMVCDNSSILLLRSLISLSVLIYIFLNDFLVYCDRTSKSLLSSFSPSSKSDRFIYILVLI